MRNLFAFFLAALVALSAPSRADLTLSQLTGFNVGGGAIQFVGSTTSQGSTTLSTSSLSGGIDTSIQAGDLVIVVYHICSDTDTNLTLSGAGYTWTEDQDLYQTDLAESGLAVYYTVAGASPSGNLTMTSSGSANRGQTGVLVAFRGASSTQFDASTTTVLVGNSAVVDPPSITTVSSNAVVLTAAGGCVSSTTAPDYSAPSGYTQLGEDQDGGQTESSGTNVSMVQATAPGAYNPGTMNGSSGTSNSGIGVTIAIKP